MIAQKIGRESIPLDNRPIGIFDSGLGGLTAYTVLRRELPGEDLIFFGDSGRAPYGGREREQLIHMGKQNMSLLAEWGVKAVVIACGTISSNALEELRAAWPEIVICGVITDAADRAAELSKSGRIGVIATQATINSGAFSTAIRKKRPEAEVFSAACPGFVPVIEAGHFGVGAQEAQVVVQTELKEIREKQVDTLLLGCTHFPLLAPLISDYMGVETALVDSGGEAALAMARRLRAEGLLAERARGSSTFLVSGDPAVFAKSARDFLGEDISDRVQGISPFSLEF